MDNKELAKMSGQTGEERTPVYKLNEIKLNGDTGVFSLRETLAEKDSEGKYPVKEVGNVIGGVILKMRWRLFHYEEQKMSTLTSEFDNKNTDTIIVFGSNEKGLAADLKEKYKLSSQRVLYTYIPKLDQIVRIIVKASGLNGDKNPIPEEQLGLFEYVDSFNNTGQYLHEFQTVISSIQRKDPNPRKNYYAMTFKIGPQIKPENRDKIVEMMKEVHEKTTKTPFADTYKAPESDAIDYPVEDINLDDVGF